MFGSTLPVAFEITALVVLVAIIVGDLLLVAKRPHEPSMKEAGLWIGFYVTLALIFAGILFAVAGAKPAGDFVTGWLLEYSLSIDNVFVFILIMNKFAVPRKYQQEALMVGIIIALIARLIFILAGAVIVERFAGLFYVFGIFLLYTAWKQAKGEDEDDAEEGFLVRQVRRVLPLTDDYHENKLKVTVDGKTMFTPMVMVFFALGLTDVMFALDSIPAVFAITTDPFIVFTANIFALMGLRQLYFLVGGLLDRLKYLHYGIAFILGYIGVKLVVHAIHEAPLDFIPGFEVLQRIPEFPTWLSLTVIVVSMAVAGGVSLAASRREEQHAAESGELEGR